ncbi:hypothetical protein QBC33DRAFT_548426 [Phialemonium atrogriseum]|uniref:Transmembrane protein n=1 Tax=Phialemonium atrogriseum TaxID=1093897 RepID=A0AAJ0BTF1_9PEZI|nr:uncharacterized protein QBC33DRAFT_548426 [Phialemonium atrogriseum]KAK1763960.1 hypothetical protein QBC33DRAFT_548426 [Phialemonium atrogriseum]
MATAKGASSTRNETTSFAVMRIPGFILSNWITLPYYRFYRQNTLLPILSIARSLKEKDNPRNVSERLAHWRDRKLNELQFTQVAATLLSAAVIGCFSWIPQDTEHWLGPAAWYSSLALSLLAVLLSSSEAFIFSTIKNSPNRPDLSKELSMILSLSHSYWDEENVIIPNLERNDITEPSQGSSREQRARKLPAVERPVKVDIRWNMVFTWQAPMMLMAYSVIGFFMGLIIYVCTPLYDGTEFDGGSKAAIVFLVCLAFGGAVFVWCSFWAYKFVDLDGESY